MATSHEKSPSPKLANQAESSENKTNQENATRKRLGANSKQGSLDSGSTGNSRSSSIDRASPSLRTSLEEKRKGREDKNADDLMKTLSLVDTPDQKIAILVSKYSTLLEENRVMSHTLKQTQNMYSAMLKEKDKIDGELKKTALSKIKLEDLCRELQKQKHMIKKEGLEQLKEQEGKRKELSDKFKTALTEIQAAMAEGRERSDRLTQENTALTNKLTALVEQYDAQNDHSKKLVTAKELQVQLFETKVKQATLALEKFQHESLQEKHMLLTQLKERDEELKQVLQQDKELKDQLALYAEKYSEFQDNLKESNSTFNRFKDEMDKMNANMIRVQGESRKWKEKCEEANKSLLEMAQAKLQMEKQVVQQNKINEKLEALTRALQKERNDLIKLVPKSAALLESEGLKEDKKDCPSNEHSPESKADIETN